MRISDWSSDVCSSDLGAAEERQRQAGDVDVAAGGLQHGAAVTVEVADAHAGPGEHRAAEHVDVAAARQQAAVDHLDAAVAATPTQPDLAAIAGRVAGIDVDHVQRDALFLATSHAVHRIALAIQPEVAAAGVDRGEVE